MDEKYFLILPIGLIIVLFFSQVWKLVKNLLDKKPLFDGIFSPYNMGANGLWVMFMGGGLAVVLTIAYYILAVVFKQ